MSLYTGDSAWYVSVRILSWGEYKMAIGAEYNKKAVAAYAPTASKHVEATIYF
ncbi:hypothetical protein [Mesobacillus foraminis]|uniref:hypothetical protein n=1 Tax=Mesobacillus foraminis TaxID=279826 RepID=UPI0013CEC4BE|nr:hypothetical protein [Mesobacillus foraminis]